MSTSSLRHRRVALALSLTAALGTVVMLLGFTTLLHVRHSPKRLERLHVFRQLDLASACAFEEASGAIEKRFPRIPFPRRGEQRHLAHMFDFPQQLETPQAARAFVGDGVTLGAVRARTSPWLTIQARTPRGAWVALERAVLELSVDVKIHSNGPVITRRVTTRRYVSVEPAANSSSARLLIQGTEPVPYELPEVIDLSPTADQDPVNSLQSMNGSTLSFTRLCRSPE